MSRFHGLVPLTALALVISASGCVEYTSNTMRGGYTFMDGGASATREASGNFSDSLRTLTVDHRFGSVTVDATKDRPSWRWQLKVTGDDKETAEEILGQIELSISLDGEQQHVELRLPEEAPDGFRGVNSELVLELPESTDLSVTNRYGPTAVTGLRHRTVVTAQHGAVKLRDLDGEVKATTSYGPLDASRIPGCELRNQHGPVTVSEVRGDLVVSTSYALMKIDAVAGAVEIENKHGEVRVQGIGKQATIKSSYAPIHVQGVTGAASIENQHGPVHASQVSGEIDARTSYARLHLDVASPSIKCLNKHGAVELRLSSSLQRVTAETSYAGMDVTLSRLTNPWIEANTTYGEVTSDFPVLMAGTGSPTGDQPRVSLENKHGNIVIKRAGGGD